MRLLHRSCLAALCLAGLAAAGNALAQNYPAKPVRMIVPFPPGGSNDILGRTLALKLAEALKQQVIVDNRGGAGGSIGAEAAAKSPADGYTILIGHIGTLAVNPGLYPKLGYDPLKSFAPITLIANVPNVLVVHPSVPVNTAAELVAHARANPGKLFYSSFGHRPDCRSSFDDDHWHPAGNLPYPSRKASRDGRVQPTARRRVAADSNHLRIGG